MTKKWTYIPLILVFGYVPLLVRGFLFERASLASQSWFHSGADLDIFLMIKSWVIVICAGASLIIFLIITRKPRWSPVFILLFAALAFSVISGILSPWRGLVFTGSYGVFEGLFVLVSYVILCFITFQYISRDGIEGISFIYYASSPGILLVTLIGIFQWAGHDIFKSQIFQNIIMDKNTRLLIGPLETNVDDPVFSTMYNADYLGIYCLILLPISIAILLLQLINMGYIGRNLRNYGIDFKKGSGVKLGVSIAVTLSLGICLFATGSLGARLTLIILGLVLLLVYLYRNFGPRVLVAAAVVAAVFVISCIRIPALREFSSGLLNIEEKNESLYQDLDSAELIFNDRFLNNRGLIWNHTAPLLKEHMMLGSGANTFIMEYPQGVDPVKFYYGWNTLDAKAHSFYLQQWVENGFVTMILLVFFLVWLLVELFRKKTTAVEEILKFGFILSVMGFGVMGILMDSNVCSSPVFWVIAGLAAGIIERPSRY